MRFVANSFTYPILPLLADSGLSAQEKHIEESGHAADAGMLAAFDLKQPLVIYA
jgi:hypothetical protein